MHAQMLTSKMGGELVSFKLDDIEKIHQGIQVVDENGKVYWKRHAPVLFPIVGKLKKNQTIINGKTYEMCQHGFARDLEFEPITKLDNFHSYVLRSNKTTKLRYPFEFELYITYRLDENKLTTIYKVVNKSDVPMPFGIGGHPAFKIDYNELKEGNYYLEFEEEEPKIHFLYLVDGLIGTEYAQNRLKDKRKILLDSHSFDNDAMIMKGMSGSKLSLKNRKTGKTIITMDYAGFPYLAVWSKPGAPFLCIEPWKTTADSWKTSGIFAEKTDTIKLKPDEEYECKYTIEFF